MRAATGLALLLAVTAGCAAPPAPDGFLVVDDGAGHVKAIASDDSMFWVRTFRDDLRGSLDFWHETLTGDFVDHRGYAALDERSVRWDGVDAIEMTFETTARGRARRYLVTLRVDEGVFADRIRVAEFVADKGTFDEHLPLVRAALGTD